MVDQVRSDDVSRLLFDMYGLIEHVRSLAPDSRVDPETWRVTIAARTEKMWDALVAAFYKAEPEAFREAITTIIDAASPVTQQLQNPQIPLGNRAVLTEEIMREYNRSILPHTDENGILKPDVALVLDRALTELRLQGQNRQIER